MFFVKMAKPTKQTNRVISLRIPLALIAPIIAILSIPSYPIFYFVLALATLKKWQPVICLANLVLPATAFLLMIHNLLQKPPPVVFFRNASMAGSTLTTNPGSVKYALCLATA